MADTSSSPKKPLSRFKKGKSGNPRGRPKGGKNAVTILREAVLTKSEKQILDHFPKIVAAVCRAAEKGDMKAAKLIMDRIIPARKAIEHTQGEVQGSAGINIIIKTSSGQEAKIGEIVDGEYTSTKEESKNA